ncbi:MAG: nucleotidyl transferase AbiEii/AbiGii toxin family protein [Thermoflexales bacterium]|nr:nucleotidyl transferase AbiEii/AbiGii toxin family protein [Thermoflexales bacterium]
MKEYLASLVRAAPNPAQGRNVAREYLQARLLGALQRAGAMIPLAFHGGTLLRFLYAIPRYSEDLDFALEGNKARYDFRAFLHAIRAELGAEGYAVELKVSDQKVVHSAFIRFGGLLYELGLSPHRDEVLSVKFEVDTNPPAGAQLATSVVRRYVLLHLQHHDPASLLAGKLHAVLQRPYPKGRDVYDLLWYLSDPRWPQPNLVLLNNALRQTGWTGAELTADNWRELVRARLRQWDWSKAMADVRPFLEPGAGLNLLTRENLLRVL